MQPSEVGGAVKSVDDVVQKSAEKMLSRKFLEKVAKRGVTKLKQKLDVDEPPINSGIM